MRADGGSLGGSIWEFQPGGSQFVYHFHHGSEELIIVLRGEPSVRLHDGDRQLREGDVVPLPRGPDGGHQIRNETDAIARVLIVSSNTRPDVAEYPETGKLGVALEGAEWEYHGVTTLRRTLAPSRSSRPHGERTLAQRRVEYESEYRLVSAVCISLQFPAPSLRAGAGISVGCIDLRPPCRDS